MRKRARSTCRCLGGTVTMEDISIPVPGLSGITSVTFSIDGTVDLRSA